VIALWAALAFGAECTAIVGGSVALPDGPVDGAAVVMDAGVVAAAGVDPEGLALGADSATWRGAPCLLVDARGAVVTAGLVESSTSLGVVEVGLEGASRDDSVGSADPVRAALRVVDAYNPRSTLIPVARLGGVTSAVVAPHGGFVAGTSGFVRLAGASQAEAVVAPAVAISASLSTDGSRAEGLLRLRELLHETRWYLDNRAAWEQNRARPLGAEALDLEALAAVVRREVPLVVGADRASDLEALARLATEERVRVVVVGAAEGWLVADALAAAGVGVIVDPLVYGPGSFDQVHGAADNPAKLADAGVTVAISTFSSHNARDLRVRAGNAVRGGMDPQAALAAITVNPAALFGQRDRGVLAPGAAADVVVWSGDPLEISSRVQALFIGGEPVALVSRQTELRDRYRELPGTPLPPLAP
jgi:hypothetical protein